MRAARRDASPTSSSISASTSGGTSTSRIEKLTMSQLARAARGEELGVVLQQVEERLRERERRERGEVGEPSSSASARPLLGSRFGASVSASHARLGRAKYSTRVPDSRRSERSTSNTSFRQRSKNPSS